MRPKYTSMQQWIEILTTGDGLYVFKSVVFRSNEEITSRKDVHTNDLDGMLYGNVFRMLIDYFHTAL